MLSDHTANEQIVKDLDFTMVELERMLGYRDHWRTVAAELRAHYVAKYGRCDFIDSQLEIQARDAIQNRLLTLQKAEAAHV